jgi:perosamine synthetase
MTAIAKSRLAAPITDALAEMFGTRPIALHEPVFAGRENEYLRECIDTGWVSSVGRFVDRFERDLADYTGVRHAIAVVNGTAALHVALLLAGVTRGDEVLLPALTFIATANAVAYCGATPHFVDSNAEVPGIDVERLAAYLGDIAEVGPDGCRNRCTGARIAAIVPVHIFGHVVALDSLVDLAERYGIPMVEDAAEAIGSRYRGRHAGTFGRLGTLSFNGNKTITTGGGGAILTNDEALARRAKHLTTTAKVPHAWEFIHDEIGYNYRLPNLNAALGCAQLEQLDGFIGRKRALAARYVQTLGSLAGITVLQEPASCRSNYWLQAIMLDRDHISERDDVLRTTNGAGYMTRPLWRTMHRLPMFAACPRMPLPVSEEMEQRLINVPSGQGLVNG